ncbi:heat-inducible transcription repressor HrcA [Hazenella sp. IB182357]|uniref:Heat-inducible transcription repressor HrcA n=1 Tax=Polycladospora coralii TaxID=2771432 RepID=A0A926NCM6_9BACL|nr:heat-inducible transcriptional repressor HrcA [Polycladospora coralii]MBD1371139.1 heat-inducible transcription repressor HrcA [Polycladospora coralii]MBS7530081.1 heat-inducible transcription repressor HrcA [Polycladospora coralii]
MLTKRQQLILWSIIDDYIVSAEPVGSRTLSKKEDIQFSAATIRNEMADLEEMGFLEQPHTSAGRIPSQKGYRFYVDHLLKPYMWTQQEVILLHELHQQKVDRAEKVFEHASILLSRFTNYMTFVLGPKMSESKLRHFQVIPLLDRTVVSILVTDQGDVHQQRLTMPEGISSDVMGKLVNFINHHLSGMPLQNLKKAIENELKDELILYVERYDRVSHFLDQVLFMNAQEKLFTSGANRMMDLPEFRDVDKVKSLLDLIEESDVLVKLLEPREIGVQVKIGYENHIDEIRDCSIITTSYLFNGEPVGTIGILGPTRMDYGKIIGLVDFFAKDFSKQLMNLYEIE